MNTMTPHHEPITAEDYFSSREITIDEPYGADPGLALWEVLSAEQASIKAGLDALTQLRDLTTTGRLLFRGQSRQQHGLSSSLHRFLLDETTNPLSEQAIAASELAIISDMRGRNLGRNMTDGELLMVLQHHGAPTRLMDVSERPLEALFFAAQGSDSIDGRLFILKLALDGPEHELDLADPSDIALPWTKYVRGSSQASRDWTLSVRLLKDRTLDARVIAQRGRFLVGGLHRAYGGGGLALGSTRLNAAELLRVSTLTINFPKRGNRMGSWPALVSATVEI